MRRLPQLLILVLCLATRTLVSAAPTGYSQIPVPPASDTLLAFDWQKHLPDAVKQVLPPASGEPSLPAFRIANRSSSAASLAWVSTAPYAARVEYGPSPRLGKVAEETVAGLVHFVWLRDLPAGQDVYYRIQSDAKGRQTYRFKVPAVGAGVPEPVHGRLPAAVPAGTPVLVDLRLSGSGTRSLPLSVMVSGGSRWLLNLGNLKTEDGQPFAYDPTMTAEIRVEGAGLGAKSRVYADYRVRLSEAADGDLSLRKELGSDKEAPAEATPKATAGETGARSAAKPEAATAPRLVSPTDRDVTTSTELPTELSAKRGGASPERAFLEGLLSQGSQKRRSELRGHGMPHVIPGWRGGSTMTGPSRPPRPEPPPARLQLRGDELLKELVRLRRERTDAGRFFPDVARHFPALAAKSLRSEGTIALVQGVNLVALPVDPTEAWGSFSFLSRVPAATVVTPWDGELQQFGASALRVGDEIIGTDFPFEPGRGYVVSASGSASVTVTGICAYARCM